MWGALLSGLRDSYLPEVALKSALVAVIEHFVQSFSLVPVCFDKDTTAEQNADLFEVFHLNFNANYSSTSRFHSNIQHIASSM